MGRSLNELVLMGHNWAVGYKASGRLQVVAGDERTGYTGREGITGGINRDLKCFTEIVLWF